MREQGSNAVSRRLAFSTGLSSGHLGGSGTRVMFGGTMSFEEEHGVSTRRHGHRDLGQMQVSSP
jgi:hypothetical protein